MHSQLKTKSIIMYNLEFEKKGLNRKPSPGFGDKAQPKYEKKTLLNENYL